MLIDCPSCARSYHVSRAAIGDTGRAVVCQICDTRWFVEPPSDIETIDAFGNPIHETDDSWSAAESEIEAQAAADLPAEDGESLTEETVAVAEETVASEQRDEDHQAQEASEAEPVLATPLHEEMLSEGRIEPDMGEVAAQHELIDELVAQAFARPFEPERPRRKTARPRRLADPRQVPVRPHKVSKGFRDMVAVALGFALLMGAIGKREAIARLVPGTAALYAAIHLPVNIRGLEFAGVNTIRVTPDGEPIEISGTIRNVARGRVAVPRLTFDIRGADGTVLSSFTQDAPKHSLASTESVTFVAKASSLPAGYKDVAVHFSDERPTRSLRDMITQASR